ncbi:MAG: hypothetical protein WD512_14945 [Candidatus Paceibacterota bacterium]
MEEKINNQIGEIEKKIKYHEKMIQTKADENVEREKFVIHATNQQVIKVIRENIINNEKEQEKHNTEIMLLNSEITGLKNTIETYKNHLATQAKNSQIPTIRIGVHNIRILHMTDDSITIESDFSSTISISTIAFNKCQKSALIYGVSNLTNRPIITKEMCNQLCELYYEQVTPIY